MQVSTANPVFRVTNQDRRFCGTVSGPDAASALRDWVATAAPHMGIFPVVGREDGSASVFGTPTGLTFRLGFTARPETGDDDDGGTIPPSADHDGLSVIAAGSCLVRRPAEDDGTMTMAVPHPKGGYSGVVADRRGNIVARVSYAPGTGRRGQAPYPTACMAKAVADDLHRRPTEVVAGKVLAATRKARR